MKESVHLQVPARALRLGDEARVLEGLSDARIQHDCGVVVVGKPFVALIAALGDPLLEGLPHQRVDHVGDVLARHLLGLPNDGECIDNNPEGEPEVEDIFEGEALVLWHRDVLHRVAVESLKDMI